MRLKKKIHNGNNNKKELKLTKFAGLFIQA